MEFLMNMLGCAGVVLAVFANIRVRNLESKLKELSVVPDGFDSFK